MPASSSSASRILIIADIVRTVPASATLTNAAELGAVVLIRTVPSFSLDIEIDGVLPWRAATRTAPTRPAPVHDLEKDPA